MKETSKFKTFLCGVIGGFLWYCFINLVYYGFIAYNPTDSFMDPIMQGITGALAFVCFILASIFTYLAYRWYKG